jgi:hypothetical protein
MKCNENEHNIQISHFSTSKYGTCDLIMVYYNNELLVVGEKETAAVWVT